MTPPLRPLRPETDPFAPLPPATRSGLRVMSCADIDDALFRLLTMRDLLGCLPVEIRDWLAEDLAEGDHYAARWHRRFKSLDEAARS